jgi:hypothetical protein
MSQTNINTVTNQIQKFWSPLFMDELRASTLLPSLVNKQYEGEIKKGGDTVRVSQINAPVGENRTIGTDADAFSSEQLSLSYVDIKADKRAVASYELDDLSQLQSQIDAEAAGGPASKIREALVYAVNKKMNDYLYSLVAPSTSSPDHMRNSISAFDKSELLAVRLLASAAKWDKSKGWWVLADPSYYNDILSDTTLTSKDYVEGETPVVGGQVVNKRFGFNILEDNGLAVDQAVIFHPDFLHLVMQTEVQFKISDLHAQKKFGYVISADIIYGGKLGIDGSKKHILSVASGSASAVVMA